MGNKKWINMNDGRLNFLIHFTQIRALFSLLKHSSMFPEDPSNNGHTQHASFHLKVCPRPDDKRDDSNLSHRADDKFTRQTQLMPPAAETTPDGK